VRTGGNAYVKKETAGVRSPAGEMLSISCHQRVAGKRMGKGGAFFPQGWERGKTVIKPMKGSKES